MAAFSSDAGNSAGQALLAAGSEALGLSLTDLQQAKLLQFIRLIEKWNKAYNLTAIRQPLEMVRLHLLDSLAILPYVAGPRVIDIGTGAGLPGIPLALCLPETQFVLLDSNAKKTRFVQQAILELKLDNVQVRHARVEDYQPDLPFDTVLTRAFASLSEIVQKTGHLLAPEGMILAMKGQIPSQELSELAIQPEVIPLVVPNVEGERCLVRIKLLKED